jgi:hypothetical protein
MLFQVSIGLISMQNAHQTDNLLLLLRVFRYQVIENEQSLRVVIASLLVVSLLKTVIALLFELIYPSYLLWVGFLIDIDFFRVVTVAPKHVFDFAFFRKIFLINFLAFFFQS